MEWWSKRLVMNAASTMTDFVSRETVREFVTTIAARAKAALNVMTQPGYLQMSRLHPESEKLVPSRYRLDDVERMIDDAIAAAQAGHNVYIEGRTIREDAARCNTRGKLEDTAGVFALVIDSDADKQMGWEPNGSASPSMSVETSPGNFQYWYFFRDAVAADIGQQLGERIRKAVNCDHDTGNVVQPYRVAGTANYPNKKKRERGRITVPTQLKDFSPEVLWTSELLKEAFPLSREPEGSGGGGGGAQPDESNIPADTLKVIRDGVDDGLRSHAFWNVIRTLKDCGFSVDGVIALLEKYPGGIARKYIGRLRQEVERVYNKLHRRPQHESESDEVLAELNSENAVVLDGARTMVLRFEDKPHEAGGERYTYRLPTFLRFQDFRDFYLNRYINVGDDNKISIGKWWLAHPNRRQYRGVIFTPGGGPIINERFNLWRGWGVEPKRGDWPLLREHMFEVLAARDDDVDRYYHNWLAWTVQHPAEQAEVALVFRGGIGTGKGTLGKAMCRIFGQHARHLSSPEHLTGRFNAHLRQCCFLFGDECYGPKDKSAEGTLKRLITEPTLQIEPKGRDAVEEPNRLHVMLASNNEWVIPASAHERRFAVQEVADIHQQDPNWFGPIYQEMRSGGLEALLYDLLHYDLGDWHPRQIVRTQALAKQQEESLSPLDQWWLELLQTAVLEGASEFAPDEAVSNEYEEEVADSDAYGGPRKRTVKHKGLYDQARRISPRLIAVSDHALGHYLTDHNCENAWVRRRRGWKFPPLQECRDRWKQRFLETVWRDQDATEWTFAGD
jgi:hypothetical protein